MRVVYVEPYPKSRALELHSESIELKESLDSQSATDRVTFEPFTGVGARRFLDLFSMSLGSGSKSKRKDQDGNTMEWKKKMLPPALPCFLNHIWTLRKQLRKSGRIACLRIVRPANDMGGRRTSCSSSNLWEHSRDPKPLEGFTPPLGRRSGRSHRGLLCCKSPRYPGAVSSPAGRCSRSRHRNEVVRCCNGGSSSSK
ncbi:MAG: cytidine / deoxycytidylate deaminase family protein [Rhodospirillaceae bacterium]|nr:MAG: cytidine / deoxycytidylate deaminase family protein [Rhodospirillaceae bacterium]